MIQFTDNPGSVLFLNRANMPTQDFLVNAALVSDQYDGKTAPEKRHEKLFEEMIQAGHWGCLDHAFPTFKIRAPLFVARQIMRASGGHFNEVSGRYKEIEGVFYLPGTFLQDVKRKELGEPGEPVEGGQNYAEYQAQTGIITAWSAYQNLLEYGVRKEQARMVLPVSVFTEFWMTLALSDWLHFLNLRLDSHAQAETRHIASLILAELMEAFPDIIRLWNEYARGPINDHGTIQTP